MRSFDSALRADLVSRTGPPPSIKAVPRRAGRIALTGAMGVALLAGGLAAATPAVAADEPDFGPNVTIFDESWSADEISAALMAASTESEFSLNRHQFFFKPGTYGSGSRTANPATATDIVNWPNSATTSAVAGLGASPEDVRINGALHVGAGAYGAEPNPWDCSSRPAR